MPIWKWVHWPSWTHQLNIEHGSWPKSNIWLNKEWRIDFEVCVKICLAPYIAQAKGERIGNRPYWRWRKMTCCTKCCRWWQPMLKCSDCARNSNSSLKCLRSFEYLIYEEKKKTTSFFTSKYDLDKKKKVTICFLFLMFGNLSAVYVQRWHWYCLMLSYPQVNTGDLIFWY